MPGLLEDVFSKIAQFIKTFFAPPKNEDETRRKELKAEEFDERDSFEQRSYGREETRTGVIGKAKERPTKVW